MSRMDVFVQTVSQYVVEPETFYNVQIKSHIVSAWDISAGFD